MNVVLRRALALLTGDFDVTLIDAEAGIEQINRDVVGHVEHLLLVADTSMKSLRVAEAAAEVAARLSLADHVHLVMNRLRSRICVQADGGMRTGRDVVIAALLVLMTVLEIVRPGGNPRDGILGLRTTRGDRLFISLLSAAYVHILWLFFFGMPLTWAAVISIALAAAIWKWV